MKTSVKIQGAASLASKFQRYPALLGRTMESVLTQEARALCNEYASATMPGPGLQENGNANAFRDTVEKDVRRVFAVRSNPAQVFELMKLHAPHLAKAYWHAY